MRTPLKMRDDSYPRDRYYQDALMRLGQDSMFTKTRHYDGELGAVYSDQATIFRLWAPTASQAELIIYDDWYGEIQKSILMEFDDHLRIFSTELVGDQHGLTYAYRLTFFTGEQVITNDPYAKAATVNGHRSVVVDLSRTNPEGWGERMPSWQTPEKTVIYEAHIRDLTVSESSNIQNKGKFLGLTEENRVNDYGSPAGLDYLVDLGVTHIELLPAFDYATVDETEEPPSSYNWGYDPYNYNVPEGSYATNPFDPFARITEMKELIKTFHDRGLRVIMDVVYNHVYEVENHAFHKTAPGYYFRYNEKGELTNGTGVGNDTASERAMVRKYIVDSVTYWAREYQIDGFRFDLMGIHDIDTMNEVRLALNEIDPAILLFGEGWDLYTPLSSDVRAANQGNAKFMPGIGQFNDGLREAVKGNDFEITAKGYVNGAWYMEPQVVSNFMGGVDFGNYNDPLQLIQYIEAHDNFTLYDKLVASNPQQDERIVERQHMLATTIILLAQGVPFLHAGQEFMRTKFGVRDSYNKPDEINQIDWNRQESYRQSVMLVRELIKLRHNEPLLRLTSYEEIKDTMNVIRQDYKIVHLTYECEDYQLVLVFNAQSNVLNVPVESGKYTILVEDHVVYNDHSNHEEIKEFKSIPPISTLLMKRYY
ncbi:type I pullulanase [Aerococcaceae bacterium DSM 111020]|nr:type I pullulanase [Aerococcaceae bacterium DSM 111020]